MIGAILSNTPANLLRSSGVAGDLQPGTADGSAGREREDVRAGQGSVAALAARSGGIRTLTPQAVLALQETEDTAVSARRAGDQQSATTPGAATGAGDETGEGNGLLLEGIETDALTQAASNQAGEKDDEDPDGDGLNEAEEKQVQELAQRDREVRAHEQAHARVGGQYASAPSYTFQQGPDGKRYAVGGEVQIDTSRERTPEATIRKMQIVIRAATAPAEPSSQDLKVAQQARSQLSEAQAELRQQKADDLKGDDEDAPVSEARPTDEPSEPSASASDRDGEGGPEEKRTEGRSAQAGQEDKRTAQTEAISAYRAAAASFEEAEKLFEAVVA